MHTDEDIFDPPSTVVRLAYARRDQRPPRFKVVEDAHALTDQLMASSTMDVRHTIDASGTEKPVADAAHRYLDGTPDPLGAAAIMLATSDWVFRDERKRLSLFAHRWVADHGLVFAAEAAMRLSTIVMVDQWYRRTNDLRWRAEGALLSSDDELEPVLAEVRAAIAAADDDEYARVVAAIGAMRTNRNDWLVASFLAPTETTWVDELFEDIGNTVHSSSWLRPSVAYNAAQLTATKPSDSTFVHHPRVLPTIVRTIGPAAAPVLGACLRGADDAVGKRLCAALAAMPTDDAFRILLSSARYGSLRASLLAAAARYPARAVRLLAEAAAGGDERAVELLRDHLLERPELLADVVPTLPEQARDAALATQDGATRLPAAPVESLPPVLVRPPWRRPPAAVKRVVFKDLAVSAPTRIVWTDGESERAAKDLAAADERPFRISDDWAAEVDRCVARGRSLVPALLCAPEELARPVLESWQPARDNAFDVLFSGPALAARFGADAAGLLAGAAARSAASDDLTVLVAVLDTEVAKVLAGMHVRRKTARDVVRSWLERHGLATVPYLLPTALGRVGKDRAAAESLLHALAEQEGADAVVAEARKVAGDEAADAVATTLATDPLDLLPPKPPAPVAWTSPAVLPQIRLRDKDFALPAASVADILTMFALSTLDEPHSGLAEITEACDPASLAEFGRAVFDAWNTAGQPAKDAWVLHVQGLIGDDETARRLAPVIHSWPGYGGHTRAVTGLDVLAEIGTEVALMHLDDLARNAEYAVLKTRAEEKVDVVAAKLGLTAEQLADRVVPRLGLAADGTLALDYGPRRFVVGFDEALRPTVSEADGTRRKTLPKPGAKDDEKLATAAYRRFAGLKKDVRALADDQIARLERAMVTGRRWSQADFTAYLVGHPLLWHVVRRLVWGVYDDGGALTGAFRLAEDRTLADVADESYAVPGDASVGIAHPLHLGDALTSWAELFADYEILQPFRQLGRPVMALTDAERAAVTLTRFDGITVHLGRVLGLTHRGWERTRPGEGGVEGGVVKPLPDGSFAVLELSDGIVVGQPGLLGEEQRISRVFLSTRHDGTWGNEDRPLGTLDPVTASELLADLTSIHSIG